MRGEGGREFGGSFGIAVGGGRLPGWRSPDPPALSICVADTFCYSHFVHADAGMVINALSRRGASLPAEMSLPSAHVGGGGGERGASRRDDFF